MYHQEDTFSYFYEASSSSSLKASPFGAGPSPFSATPDATEHCSHQWGAPAEHQIEPCQDSLFSFFDESWISIDHNDATLDWGFGGFDYVGLTTQNSHAPVYDHKPEPLSVPLQHQVVPVDPAPMMCHTGCFYEETMVKEEEEAPLKKRRIETQSIGVISCIGFTQIPDVLFDTATIPVWTVLTGFPPEEDIRLENTVVFYAVHSDETGKEIAVPRQVFTKAKEEFKFTHKLSDELPADKKVILRLEGILAFSQCPNLRSV